MARLESYKRILGIKTLSELERIFCDTLVQTNHTYSFFVDWQKVVKHRDVFRNELALLSSLKGHPKPKEHLRSLIAQYPEIAKVFPLLLAERDSILKVLHALKPEYQYVIYDFRGQQYSQTEINKITDFCELTGLLQMLSSMQSPFDYATGVEVGLDSNARKNRSGKFMEDAVHEVLDSLSKSNLSTTRISQRTFKHVEKMFSIPIPKSLSERKFDEVIIINGRGTNIEANFYGGTGSKPTEIVDSYSNRKRELESIGWRFVWITDGVGWKKMTNQLKIGLQNLDYVLNLHMLERGMLQEIILEDMEDS